MLSVNSYIQFSDSVCSCQVHCRQSLNAFHYSWSWMEVDYQKDAFIMMTVKCPF